MSGSTDARPSAAAASGPYPPIADYGLISDCHTVALVSRAGSIDWCCVPRIDSGSVFGRLLDWNRGGYCQLAPVDDRFSTFRSYVDRTMVLSTTFSGPGGEARILDLLIADPDHLGAQPRLLRLVEGIRGLVRFKFTCSPRFDYGEVRPLFRYHGQSLYTAIGGDDGLLISSDGQLDRLGRHDVGMEFEVHAEQRIRFSVRYGRPSELRSGEFDVPLPEQLDAEYEMTIRFWQEWADQIRLEGIHSPGLLRSALAIKALTIAQTGAIAAAATTSLPEAPHGDRNWDYRFSWIRDSSFSVRALADIGCFAEAAAFRRFIQESAAGAAEDLQIVYGVGGERRLTELELALDGYRGARPVRIGNAAYKQMQLDEFGELMELTWRWHQRGHSPDDDYWRFVVDLVDTAVEKWKEPDRGLWEMRGEPRHFVHSKVMLWAAIDRGIRLAEECMRSAPTKRWARARDAIRAAVEKEGYDKDRNTFVQAFGRKNLDASVLLLPTVGFVDYRDPRMLGTADAIRQDLEVDGLLLRYRPDETGDSLNGTEGAFLACSLWLAECLAHQARIDDARQVFDRVISTSNDLGLFSEEFDPRSDQMLGNFPQALTHLSHITAGMALNRLVTSAAGMEEPGT